MIRKDLHQLLLYLNDNDGKYLKELTEGLKWSKRRTARTIGTAENFGMVRGSWERLSETNQRWIRRYYIAGEGTRDFITTLQNIGETPT